MSEATAIGQYLELALDHRALLDAGSIAPLNARRDEVQAALAAHGLPTHRNERYKYCDVQAAFAPDYGMNLHRRVDVENAYEAYRCSVPNLSTLFYLVLGDVVVPQAGNAAPLPDGVRVCSFRQAEAEMPGFIGENYHKTAGREYDGVTALNTLLAQDGILVSIPDGVHLRQPIQIVNVADAAVDLMSNRRVLIVAGRDSEATVLFCDHAPGPARYLTTQVTEAVLGERAEVSLYTIEETSERTTRFSNVYADLAAAARLTTNTITLTSGSSRTMMDIRLTGEGASAVANGAVVADGHQVVDNNILVDHAAPGCTSDLLYKYVLDEQSVGAYAGKVLVRNDAQQTQSEQTNANICAAPTARAYSQPMLEIYADDVRCNHGSSIGKLDETALFYMQQRGIPEQEARLLLQHAFINDVLRRVTLEHLRDRLSHLVELRFRGQLSACRDCKACGSSSKANQPA